MLGVDRFALVGHSLGGAVATALAELLPAHVCSLVLLAPAGFGRVQLAEAASIPGVRDLLHAAFPRLLSSCFAVTTGFRTMVTNGNTPDRDVVERIISRGGELVAGAREGTRAVVAAGLHHDAFYRPAGRLPRSGGSGLGRPRPAGPGIAPPRPQDRTTATSMRRSPAGRTARSSTS